MALTTHVPDGFEPNQVQQPSSMVWHDALSQANLALPTLSGLKRLRKKRIVWVLII
jgi:hypothetical protein